MKKSIYLFILLFTHFLVIAQEDDIKMKSNRKKSNFSRTKPQTNQLLLKKAVLLKYDNPSLAIDLISQALSSAIAEEDLATQKECYGLLGEINLQNGLYEIAIKNLEKSIEIKAERIENNFTILLLLAEAYQKSGNFKKALFIIEPISKSLHKNNKKVFYLKASILVQLNEKKEAIDIYKMLEKQEKVDDNLEGIRTVNKLLGELYQSKQNNKEALNYYQKSKIKAKENKDAQGVNEANQKISNVLKQEKRYDEELSIRLETAQETRILKDTITEKKENIAVASTYLDIMKPDKALPYLNRTLDLAQKTGDLENKSLALKYLSKAYEQKKQYDKALETYKKYFLTKDSLLKKREDSLSLATLAVMNISTKQKKIDLLEKDVELNRSTINALTNQQIAKDERIKRMKWFIYFLIIGLIIIIIASVLIYINDKKRRLANQLLVLKSLRNQMNPHFIFNALNSVNSFISKSDERSANKYLADFSKLMRMVMENSQSDFISLSQEIDILKLYLSLEQFRFKDKFNYTFEMDHEIDLDHINIPPMIIQPYIENAIWHGLRYKETMGTLTIKMEQINESLLVQIVDNGIGRKKSQTLKTENQLKNKSTGIKNTEMRIILINELYKKQLKIEMTDLDTTMEDTGTLVKILIPDFE